MAFGTILERMTDGSIAPPATAKETAPPGGSTRAPVKQADFGPKLRGWLRFTELYYVSHFLLVLSYALSRYYAVHVAEFSHKRIVHNEDELFRWEKQALLLLGIVMAVKGWKALSLDMFLADFFMYAKATLAALAYAMDIRIFVYYVIAMIVLFLISQQPCYAGPDKIKYFTPGTFNWEVEENHKGVIWLVELYAPWSPPCIHLEPVYADLSLKYTTAMFKFGKLDLGRWPQAARDFKVDVNGVTDQLPTIIMFKAGVEVGRIPQVFQDGSCAKGKFTRSDIVRAFDLDGIYARLAATGKDKKKKKKDK